MTPKPPPAAPPDHLSESAKTAWTEIVSGFAGTPKGAECAAVEAYAVAVSRMREAQRRIDAEGMIVADDKGRPIPHPALLIERAASAEVERWAKRYSPRSRL